MGTNYYLYKKGNGEPFWERRLFSKELHIGKNSCGWNFLLHGYTRLGINNPEDWDRLLTNDNYVIKNEYGEEVDSQELINLIYHKEPYFKKEDFISPSTLRENEVKNGLLQRKEEQNLKNTPYTCDMLFDVDFC